MYWFSHWHSGHGHSRGQGLIDYALIIAFVAFIVIGALVLLAPHIAAVFQTIKTGL